MVLHQSAGMSHPLVYEINTRCWLRELSTQAGRPIQLANIPESEFARWQQLGFTHIWLMGVWPTGPRSRARSLSHPDQLKRYGEILADWREEDVAGSPFAVADYRVSEAVGGEVALQQFRRQLNGCGLKLILDFVPNHLGLDHLWVAARPELFVQGPLEVPGTFRQVTDRGARWLAHGKDPYFPAWDDTVQLDYRLPETRAAMLEVLQSVAPLCDGVRCDMAMLLLNEVFAKTWESFPAPTTPPATEFWSEAIQNIKGRQPEFLFLAEVYWDLEARLQSLGFDYTYDKRLYDYLVYRQFAEASRHVQASAPGFIEAGAHFLENHDEPRIAAILDGSEHRAGALLILGLPGMRLVHEGQLSGARVRAAVHLSRRPQEPVQQELTAYYEKLLTALRDTSVGHGSGTVLSPRTAWSDNPTANSFAIVQWQAKAAEFDLVVVNLARHRSQCYAPLTIAGLSNYNWQMRDLLGEEVYQRRGDDLEAQGLYLDLPALGAQLFHFEPVV